MPKKKATEEEIEEVKTEEEVEEGFIAHPDAPPEEEEVEEEVEDKETIEGEEKEKEKEEKVEEEETKEKPVFKLEEEKPEPKEKGGEEEPESIEIIHGGQAYKFTKDKIIELAQKGFDYDKKVGPHGKLVQMIETDPGLAQMINNYWQGKLAGTSEGVAETKPKFEAKPLKDYETETEWLQDNFQNFLKTYEPPKKEESVKPRQDGPESVKNMLKMRDPVNFEKVFPSMMDAIPNLSVRDYKRIDSDLGALCQFYDFVKGQATEVPKKETVENVDKPGFRVRSGGGEAPKDEEKADYAWNLNKDDFQKQLNKVKGYS